jgi:hypothetical protein
LPFAVANVDLPAAFVAKLEKNEAKYPADVVRGSAAKYAAACSPRRPRGF